jgi:chromosome segregation ATPase
MADYSEIVKRLRDELEEMANQASVDFELWNRFSNRVLTAAVNIEAQAREIAELKRMLQRKSDELNVLSGSIAAYHAEVHESRITKLESENAKLREALTKIEAKENYSYMRVWTGKSEPDTIARAALGE